MHLVTGSDGFVGRRLCQKLLENGGRVRGTVLSAKQARNIPKGVGVVETGSIDAQTDWSTILEDVSVIVHLAARVHVMREISDDPLREFRRTNVEGSRSLIKAAVEKGIKRFVFLSTIGVNGNVTFDRPFSEMAPPDPYNHYSRSKYEAEEILRESASNSRTELVIIRSPLIYGAENPGNFLRLLRLVRKGCPLPLLSVTNLRSFIYVGNLIDVIVKSIVHPDAANQTYFVSDCEDTSTPELIRRLASALGVKERLFPFPPSLLRLAGKLAGKSAEVDRLTASLQIDTTRIVNELGWKPPYTMEQGLKETAEWYLSTSRQ